MDEKRLQDIEARYQASTEGEWYVCPDWDPARSVPLVVAAQSDLGIAVTAPTLQRFFPANPQKDATFIAHAHQDIPELVAEVRRLKAILATANHLQTLKHEDWHHHLSAEERAQVNLAVLLALFNFPEQVVRGTIEYRLLVHLVDSLLSSDEDRAANASVFPLLLNVDMVLKLFGTQKRDDVFLALDRIIDRARYWSSAEDRQELWDWILEPLLQKLLEVQTAFTDDEDEED